MNQDRNHFIAILQALLVTFLWSLSFVLITIGLDDVPAITFAGMRYTLAAIILFIFLLAKKQIKEFRQITKHQWIKIISLGFVMYFLTQGAQYLGLSFIPAIQVSLILNFTPVAVLVFGSLFLDEKPTRNNIIGITIFLIGGALYFFPMQSSVGPWFGYLIMFGGMISNAIATVMGRDINKHRSVSPILITTISMGIGGLLLLFTGITVEPTPTLSLNIWGIVLLLAIVNTAFAFTLWNKTMQVLTSVESSVINNTMLVQIAILSWLFLGEPFTAKSLISILIASVGIFLVQYKGRKKPSEIEVS